MLEWVDEPLYPVSPPVYLWEEEEDLHQWRGFQGRTGAAYPTTQTRHEDGSSCNAMIVDDFGKTTRYTAGMASDVV